MEPEIINLKENLERLTRDVDLLKKLFQIRVNEEGELSEWAKVELEEARKEPDKELISLENLKKEIKDGLSG